jgi:hypothetical protein
MLFPFPLCKLFPATYFLYFQKLALQHVFEKEREKVDDRMEKAVRFFVPCQPNPDTRVNVTEAMWTKGYSDDDAANMTLQMQVHCAIHKIRKKSLLVPS